MDAFVKVDLGKHGTLYVLPVGNKEFAHLFITTNPDSGGPIGQETAVLVNRVAYHVTNHRHLKANPIAPGGVVLAPWPTFPGGTRRIHDQVFGGRKDHSGGFAPAALSKLADLIDEAARQYLKRPESFEEIQAARRERLTSDLGVLLTQKQELKEKMAEIDKQIAEIGETAKEAKSS